MKVLIVDDNVLNIKIAQRLLEHEGVEVDSCLTGYECSAKVNNEPYDMIFMDIMMPELSGIETLHKLQENENFATPVVALTADAETGAKEKYLDIGFYDYMPKPIQLDRLREIISSVANKN